MLTKVVNGERIELTPEEEQEVRAKWKVVDDEKLVSGYLVERRIRYPSVAKQTEAVYAGFKKMREDGATLDPITAEWVDQIEAIHTTHPPGS